MIPAGAGSMPTSRVIAFADAWKNHTIGIGDDVDALDGQRHPERCLLVLRQRDGLRHELAERHVEVRHERVREDERDAVREQPVDPVGDDRLGDDTEEDRERGDAELDGADEAHRAVHDANGDPRPPHASVGELLQTRASRRHERVLGRDEEAVREHDQENGEELERNRHAPFSGAQVLGGSSSSKMLRANYRRAAAVRSRGLAARPRTRLRRARRYAPVVRAAEPGRLHALALVARRDGRRPRLREAG